MFGLFRKKAASNNPSSGLSFFQSRHRIDDAYLADLMREKTPTGEVATEIYKMCDIVGAAIEPIYLSAILLGDRGSPSDEGTVGYLFGWLDVFKTNVWHVSDFNRSFFHNGFLAWFSRSERESRQNLQNAMDAMTCLGIGIMNSSPGFTSAAQRGSDEARAFLTEGKPPKGPSYRR